MSSDELSTSGIRRLANYSPYLDVLASFAGQMDLRQRSNLVQLEKALHSEWGLGQNCILAWSPEPSGVAIIRVPHYAVAEYASPVPAGPPGARLSERFISSLLTGHRMLDQHRLLKVCKLLDTEPRHIKLRQPLGSSQAELDIVEQMIKRYGISYVPSRAVALFDIVGFSLLSPFEQMTQLNSLSYSLNSAQSKLMQQHIGVSFARSTTGDGFYIWNRELNDESNSNLYHFMHLVLADNAIARQRAVANAVPTLRAAFHVGSCYEFHQAEGLNPTIHEYIVGDVTIELARMIERAMPGQIFVGDFRVQTPKEDLASALDAIRFVDDAQQNLAQLNGVELSGERISAIKCYLTGERHESGDFSIRRLVINDKHGLSRNVYNAKVNIYRESAAPILLGIEDRKVRERLNQFASFDLIDRQPH